MHVKIFESSIHPKRQSHIQESVTEFLKEKKGRALSTSISTLITPYDGWLIILSLTWEPIEIKPIKEEHYASKS